MNILIVEDDKIIREGIAEYFRENKYIVYSTDSAESGLELLGKEKIHLIILDIMLPGMNGIEFLSEIRKENNIPIIILTALSDEQTQVKSFDELADDYLTKPFSLIVLHKRVDTQIRHYYGNKEYWKYKDVEVDFSGYCAYYKSQPVNLTAKEFKLLEILIENKGVILSRDKILDKMWQYADEPYERVIDVYIKNLRKKLNLDCILTVKGVGYKMEIS